MQWKTILRDYLSFTRKDRIGILVVFILMLFLLFLPPMLNSGPGNSPETIQDTSWISMLEKLENNEEPASEKEPDEEPSAHQFDRPTNSNNEPGGELFYFDPNTLAPAGWKRLGLRDKTIQTIQNYLQKGGHFKKSEDLQRIYGLRPEQYARLAPYVRIEKPEAEKSLYGNPEENRPVKKDSRSYTIIDINSADTTAFISLPGIGSKLALRIINFRDKLGGFYSIDQVGETFGLPDSTFQKIKAFLKLENKSVKKININSATIEDLKSHPYIRYILANPIVSYRNEHGPFLKIEDIKKLMIVSDDIYNKIAPYLTLNN